jgi:hypothetical protein
MVKPKLGFYPLALGCVDYQVTGYSYDTLSLGYMAIPCAYIWQEGRL